MGVSVSIEEKKTSIDCSTQENMHDVCNTGTHACIDTYMSSCAIIIRDAISLCLTVICGYPVNGRI